MMPSEKTCVRVHKATGQQAIQSVLASVVDHSTSRAYATSNIQTSNGKVPIPRLNTNFPTVKALVDQVQVDLKAHDCQPMSDSTVRRVITAIRTQPATILCGLDTASSELGRKNFAALEDLAVQAHDLVSTGSAVDLLPLPKLSELLTHVSEFLQYYYPELIHSAAPAQPSPSHDILLCSAHALGFPACPAQHNTNNVSLRSFFRLQTQLDLLISQVAQGGYQEAEQLSAEWKERRALLNAFLVHQMHGCHQDKWAATKTAELGQNTAFLIVDYKNKVLPLFRREAASQFYGKEGMVLFGTMWSYYPVIDGRGVPYCLRDFDDITTTDKVQDGFLSVMLLATSILRMKQRRPEVTRVFLQTDSGPHFACTCFVVGLHMLNATVLKPRGIEIVEFSLSAPGWGKSALDAHFAVIGQVFANCIRS